MAPFDAGPSCPHSSSTRAEPNRSRAGRTTSTIRRSGPFTLPILLIDSFILNAHTARDIDTVGSDDDRGLSFSSPIAGQQNSARHHPGPAHPIQPDANQPTRQDRATTQERQDRIQHGRVDAFDQNDFPENGRTTFRPNEPIHPSRNIC